MRNTALLISFLLVFGSPLRLLAASAPPAQPGEDYPVPSEAAPGSTAERTSAWESLTSTQQQQYVDTFWDVIVPQAMQQPTARQGGTGEATPRRAPDPLGGAVARPGAARVSASQPQLLSQKQAAEEQALPVPCPEVADLGCGCPLPIGSLTRPSGEPFTAVQIVASPTSGAAPLAVQFSVNWSEPISSYFWNFGDGSTSSAASPSHTYTSAGTRTVYLTVTHAVYCSTYSDTQTISVSAPPPAAPDLDADGLPDQFEDDLAYAFRPFYHVSAGELSGTGFANFGNYVPQTVVQSFPAVPVRNHVRVKPLGTTWYNGQNLGVVQIDYFTMWNRDDGLVVSSACIFLTGGIAWFLEPIIAFGHTLDNERSAALVAAPLVGGAYNTNPAAYKAYDYYTAAHEDTINDKSLYFSFSSPVPAYNSVQLGLSLSKHASYPFNPNGLPLAPSWVIYSTYDYIFWLYWTGQIDFWDYLIYLYIADVVFYVCWIEHFIEQGGALPGASKNIGDVGHAINGSGFIETSALRQKLNKILWIVN